MTEPVTWTNETRRLSELIPWPRNPRQIRQDQARRLNESLDEFGQVDVIAIGPGGEVYNGHQRLNVWAAEHGPDLEVAVRVASRELTEKEREKLVVFLHKGAAGEWDFDLLSDFEVPDLLEWGFSPYDLGLEGEDVDYDELWKGMPEFEQEDMEAYRKLIVYFDNEEDVQTFAGLIGQEISGAAKWIWHPYRARENFLKSAYQDES